MMNKDDDRMSPGESQHSMEGSPATSISLPGQEELLIQKKPMGAGSAVELIKANESNDAIARSVFPAKFLFQAARALKRRNSIKYGHSDIEGVLTFIIQGSPSIDGLSRKQFIEAYKAEASNNAVKGLRSMGRSSPQGAIQS